MAWHYKEFQFTAAELLRKDAALDKIVDVITCDGIWSRQGHVATSGVDVVASRQWTLIGSRGT